MRFYLRLKNDVLSSMSVSRSIVLNVRQDYAELWTDRMLRLTVEEL